MTDPTKTTPPKPRARERRDRPLPSPTAKPKASSPNADSVSSPPEGTQSREGVGKSGPAVPGTGAGATFSGSRNRGGGVKRGDRAKTRAVGADVNGGPSVVAPENAEPSAGSPAANGESAPAGKVIGGRSWDPAPAEGDPGTGFYRFRKADIPDLDARQGSQLGTVIETFGKNLADAQRTIGFLVAKAKRQSPPQPVNIRPTHFRRTQLSKKQRLALAK
jgi:hypothetical protein